MIRNTLFDTEPCIVHGHGRHRFKPHWDEVRDGFAASVVSPVEPPENLTVLTCNNGHQAMGMLERSCERWGQPYVVCGQGRTPWVNSKDKPEAILEALSNLSTDYVLYADSRDAIVVADLNRAMTTFREEFSGCRMLMGADRINWPNVAEFKRFEESLPGAKNKGKFSYLNGGVWLAERAFAKAFFEEALRTEPVAAAAESEQGILKKLFPRYYPEMQLDYQSKIIVNLGFVLKPIMEFVCPASSSTASSATA